MLVCTHKSIVHHNNVSKDFDLMVVTDERNVRSNSW